MGDNSRYCYLRWSMTSFARDVVIRPKPIQIQSKETRSNCLEGRIRAYGKSAKTLCGQRGFSLLSMFQPMLLRILVVVHPTLACCCVVVKWTSEMESGDIGDEIFLDWPSHLRRGRWRWAKRGIFECGVPLDT